MPPTIGSIGTSEITSIGVPGAPNASTGVIGVSTSIGTSPASSLNVSGCGVDGGGRGGGGIGRPASIGVPGAQDGGGRGGGVLGMPASIGVPGAEDGA